MTFKIASACLFILLAAGSFARADDPPLGRLADGRAYRTDPEGNQLVDYLAELEVQNEALTRRVNGLEDENKIKQNRIDSLLRASGKQSGYDEMLSERDLIKQPETSSAAVSSASVLPEPRLPEAGSCETQLTNLRESAASARFDLELQRNQFERELSASRNRIAELERRPPVTSVKIESADAAAVIHEQQSSAVRACQDRLSTLNDLVAAARFDFARQQEQCDQKLKYNYERIAELEHQAAIKAVKAGAITEVTTTQAEPKVAEVMRVPVAQQILAAEPRPEQSSSAKLLAAPRARLMAAAAPESPARDRALVVVRGSINTELNKLKGLIAQRDRQFEQYNRQQRALSLKPAALRSSRELTLIDIEQNTDNAISVHQLTALRADINELRAKVNEDVALVQRMTRAR